MALPVNTPSNEIVVGSMTMTDVSAPSSTYAACPVRGTLVRAYSVLGGAITGADCTWTVKVNSVACTGTATIANASSAAGDVDSVQLTGPATGVRQGDTIEFVSAGESSTTATAHFYAVIRT